MKLWVPYFLLSCGIEVVSFRTPSAILFRKRSASPSVPFVVSTTVLQVSSSSVPPEDGSDPPAARVFAAEVDVEETGDKLSENLVQGGLLLLAVGISYSTISTIGSMVSGWASSTATSMTTPDNVGLVVVSGIGSVLSALVVAVWEVLQYVLPIIFSALYQGIQTALPILKDFSSDVAVLAAPYVEEARSEMSHAAGPYVEQLIESLQQATDATAILEPIQRASQSLSTTVDSTIFSPLQDFQQVVDSNLMAPVKEVQERVAMAVDANMIAPMDHVKTVVEQAKASVFTEVENKLSLPVNQVKHAVEKSLPTAIDFQVPPNSAVEDMTVAAFKASPIPIPDLELGRDFVTGIEGSVK